MISKGALGSLYDEGKVNELENSEEELSGKDIKKLENYQNNKPVFDAIVAALESAVSEEVYLSPEAFLPVLTKVLAAASEDEEQNEKIAGGLYVMDKAAEIQRDKKGNIIYDKESKDTEIVKYKEDIDTYMARE